MYTKRTYHGRDAQRGGRTRLLGIALTALVLLPVTACGEGDARSRPEGSGAQTAKEKMLARCGQGSVTSVSDRRADSSVERELDPSGKLRRAFPGDVYKPFTGTAQPWLDLERVTVNVHGGVLCVTIRTAAPAPKDAEYALLIAPSDSPGVDVLLIGQGAVSFNDGRQHEDEDVVAHAYRRRATTVNVAVRVDVDRPRGIGLPLYSYDRFRWRMRSAGDSMRKGKAILSIVDCTPWISYPQGQRADRPRTDDGTLRCPRS